MYREVHRAMRNEIRTLAAIGIRLTVERLCAQKEAQGARLVDQISDLHKKGFLTAEQTTGLHSIRFLGKDAAHDAAEPVDVELGAAMDVLDGVLDSVYVLPARRKRLAALRRQRKTRYLLQPTNQTPWRGMSSLIIILMPHRKKHQATALRVAPATQHRRTTATKFATPLESFHARRQPNVAPAQTGRGLRS